MAPITSASTGRDAGADRPVVRRDLRAHPLCDALQDLRTTPSRPTMPCRRALSPRSSPPTCAKPNSSFGARPDCGIANVNIGPSGAEIGGAFGGEKEPAAARVRLRRLEGLYAPRHQHHQLRHHAAPRAGCPVRGELRGDHTPRATVGAWPICTPGATPRRFRFPSVCSSRRRTASRCTALERWFTEVYQPTHCSPIRTGGASSTRSSSAGALGWHRARGRSPVLRGGGSSSGGDGSTASKGGHSFGAKPSPLDGRSRRQFASSRETQSAPVTATYVRLHHVVYYGGWPDVDAILPGIPRVQLDLAIRIRNGEGLGQLHPAVFLEGVR